MSGSYQFGNSTDHWAGGVSCPTVDSSGAIYVNVTDTVKSATVDDGLGGVYKFVQVVLSDSPPVRQKTMDAPDSATVQTSELGHSAPVIDETLGVVYVGRGEDYDTTDDFHYLYALDQGALDVIWKYSTSPLTVTATVGPDGTIYVGTSAKPMDRAGIFHAINPDGTGK